MSEGDVMIINRRKASVSDEHGSLGDRLLSDDAV